MSAVSYAGIPLALLATTAYNVGLIVEKRALGRMPPLDVRRVPSVIVSLLTSRVFAGYPQPLPLRYAGVTMCAVFLIGLIALPFAPETKGKPLPE